MKKITDSRVGCCGVDTDKADFVDIAAISFKASLHCVYKAQFIKRIMTDSVSFGSNNAGFQANRVYGSVQSEFHIHQAPG